MPFPNHFPCFPNYFVVAGYVVMPEYVHLLISEPERGDPSVVMKALKQGKTGVDGTFTNFHF